MKILATIKRTLHRDARPRADDQGKLEIQPDAKWEINPFDELAVEQALRLVERHRGETLAVSVGGPECREQLVGALAVGIDRALRVDAPGALDGLQIAKVIAAVARRESVDLLLCGKLAVDDENGQIPAMAAALLGWPLASQASRVELVREGTLRVRCETDSGVVDVDVDLPAVVTADLRLCEPRYASLPGIMKAKKKPLDVIQLADLGTIGEPRVRATAYRNPPPRSKGKIVGSAEELVRILGERQLI